MQTPGLADKGESPPVGATHALITGTDDAPIAGEITADRGCDACETL
ncbi:MAG: hypothetical protein JJU11_02280 [Candidatus Sumerlaeia bacterium]|nr:hypothetical protein [Candidatus Sumerlaeia bacterium]